MDYLGYSKGKVALISRAGRRLVVRAYSTYTHDVKQLYTKKMVCISGLETRQVLLRNLTLKLKSKREIVATLPFQVEDLIPYSEEETILLPTLRPKQNETDIFLLATSKQTVENHLESLDFDPDVVSCKPMALFRFARHCFPEVDRLFFYHEDTFVVIQGGKLCSAQFSKPEEIDRVSAYLMKKYPHIDTILSFEPLKQFAHFVQLELADHYMQAFAIPIGLALDGAIRDGESAQFRQHETVSSRSKQKIQHLMLTFAACCLSFAICHVGLGTIKLKKEEKAVLEALQAPKHMSLARYTESLERQLRQKKGSEIAIPTVPRVHEVLHWLSSHPTLKDDCSITHFKYHMVKAPKLGTALRKYEVKVDLELSTENPRAARAFHEALLKETSLINRRLGVKWTADHGVYHASFTLKERPIG